MYSVCLMLARLPSGSAVVLTTRMALGSSLPKKPEYGSAGSEVSPTPSAAKFCPAMVSASGSANQTFFGTGLPRWQV